MTLSNHRENGDGERDGDGGEVQNVVRYANCTLQKSGEIVGWRSRVFGEFVCIYKKKAIFVARFCRLYLKMVFHL